MSHKRIHWRWLIGVALSWGIAALALFGVILPNDTTGRVIFGIVWIAVGIGWLGWGVGAFSSRASGS